MCFTLDSWFLLHRAPVVQHASSVCMLQLFSHLCKILSMYMWSCLCAGVLMYARCVSAQACVTESIQFWIAVKSLFSLEWCNSDCIVGTTVSCARTQLLFALHISKARLRKYHNFHIFEIGRMLPSLRPWHTCVPSASIFQWWTVLSTTWSRRFLCWSVQICTGGYWLPMQPMHHSVPEHCAVVCMGFAKKFMYTAQPMLTISVVPSFGKTIACPDLPTGANSC